MKYGEHILLTSLASIEILMILLHARTDVEKGHFPLETFITIFKEKFMLESFNIARSCALWYILPTYSMESYFLPVDNFL